MSVKKCGKLSEFQARHVQGGNIGGKKLNDSFHYHGIVDKMRGYHRAVS